MNKFKKIFYFSIIKIIGKFNPLIATKVSYYFYKKNGLRFNGFPNYIASTVYFDGGDYSLIELGEGVTISGHVVFLTHDWALNTILKSMNFSLTELVGRHKGIIVEKNVFIGTHCILLPGVSIGEGSIVGAGSVVRGSIPKFSLVIGNPGKIIGDTRDYARTFLGIVK